MRSAPRGRPAPSSCCRRCCALVAVASFPDRRDEILAHRRAERRDRARDVPAPLAPLGTPQHRGARPGRLGCHRRVDVGHRRRRVRRRRLLRPRLRLAGPAPQPADDPGQRTGGGERLPHRPRPRGRAAESARRHRAGDPVRRQHRADHRGAGTPAQGRPRGDRGGAALAGRPDGHARARRPVTPDHDPRRPRDRGRRRRSCPTTCDRWWPRRPGRRPASPPWPATCSTSSAWRGAS